MSRALWLSVILVAASLAFGAYLYPGMPQRIASHWDAQGQVNGYMPRSWGVFLLPAITLILLAFFYALPKIDPLKGNILSFKAHYDNFILIFTGFMTLIYLQTMLWNAGVRVNPMAVISFGLFVLFHYTGVLLENSKRNWFIGIRTPWTLSSDTVWEKTHRIGGRMFKACGIICLLGVILPDFAILFIIVPIILTAVYTTVYSNLEYRKERPQG
jgi:uncharacterized membrane protein